MFVKGLSTVFINIDIFLSIEVPLAPIIQYLILLAYGYFG